VATGNGSERFEKQVADEKNEDEPEQHCSLAVTQLDYDR
jgi:hypothetical protein